jgi:type II secretory pathway component GspD/PulD (secretin)
MRPTGIALFALLAAVAIPAAGAEAPGALALRDNPDLHMVAVEALVVEVDEERTSDLGLQYGFNPRMTAGDGTVVLDDAGIVDGGNVRLGRPLSPVRVPVLVKSLQGETGVGFDSTRLPGLGANLAGMNVGGHVVAARLRALLDEGEAVIRTRPIAVALNGSMVRIETVNNVPYLDRRDSGKLEINEKRVGIQMTVTPTIEDLRTRLVRLEIHNLRVSSISSFITTENIDRPVVNTSEARSSVTLREGETFVVGGLKTRRRMEMEDRVPVLHRIPLVGFLFKSREEVDRSLDVLFFITPYILKPGQNFLLPFDFRNQKALGIDVAADLQDR